MPSSANVKLPPRHWQLPVELGTPGAAQPSKILLLDGSAEVPAGRLRRRGEGQFRRYRLLPRPIRAERPRRAREVACKCLLPRTASTSSPIAGR